MKRLFTTTIFLLAVLLSFAALPDKRLVLKVAEGESGYPLKSISCLKFSNGSMLLNMNDGSVLEWETDNVAALYLEYYEGGGEETSVNQSVNSSPFEIDGGVLRAAAGNAVLYTADGRVICNGECNAGFVFRLDLLPAGVYLFEWNGKVFKIVNR